MTHTKIYSIDSVHVSILESHPLQLVVCAGGRVVSTGWRNPELVKHHYFTPPEDGIQDFDFTALPPDSDHVVIPILTPILAEFHQQSVDVENYWGEGKPLIGVRIHAISNFKTASLNSEDPNCFVSIVRPGDQDGDTAPGFDADIKGLFRAFPDVTSMISFGINLHDYDSVKSHAASILARLNDGSMPCDGPWPPSDIDKFESWINADFPA